MSNWTVVTPARAEVLKALRAEVENTCTDANGVRWGTVYLPNVRIGEFTARQFAGYLSALKATGDYRPLSDKTFGEVRMGA